MRRAAKILATLIALGTIASGCAKNPFSTRGTEPPLGSGGTWETPQSPEVVIRNLLFAVNEMNETNYEHSLSDLFTFSAPEDSIDAANGGRPDLFADWDKAVEAGVAINIFTTFVESDSLGLYLTLTLAAPDVIEESTATLHRNYDLRIISGLGGADTLTAKGLATFHLTQEQLNWWTVRGWEDKPVQAGAYDWGDFKAEYRR